VAFLGVQCFYGFGDDSRTLEVEDYTGIITRDNLIAYFGHSNINLTEVSQ
jgi:hypothetical protein